LDFNIVHLPPATIETVQLLLGLKKSNAGGWLSAPFCRRLKIGITLPAEHGHGRCSYYCGEYGFQDHRGASVGSSVFQETEMSVLCWTLLRRFFRTD
jgi:hypothetical protein